jgi:hypothetical protein
MSLEDLKNIPKSAEEFMALVNKGLAQGDKPMTSEVAQALYPKASLDLIGMGRELFRIKNWRDANKLAFTGVEPRINQRFEDIVRTNAVAATDSLGLFKNDPNYTRTLTVYAASLDANPAFARQQLDALEKNPASLKKMYDDFKAAYEGRRTDAYITQQIGAASPAPAAIVAAGAGAGAAQNQQQGGDKKPGGFDKPAPGKTQKSPPKTSPQRPAAPAAPSAPVAAPGGAVAGVAAPAPTPAASNEPDPDLSGTPQEQLERFLKNPNNKKFADQIDRLGLRDRLMKTVDENGMRALSTKAMMNRFMKHLEAGQANEFLAAFAGPQTPKSEMPQMNMQNILSGLGGMFGDLMDMGSMLGAHAGLGNLMGTNNAGELKRTWRGQGSGDNFKKLFANPTDENLTYAQDLTRRATLALAAKNDPRFTPAEQANLARMAQETLSGVYSADQIKDIMAGNKIPFVEAKTVYAPDGKGTVTLHAGVMDVTRPTPTPAPGAGTPTTVPGVAPAANEPPAAPVQQVAGGELVTPPAQLGKDNPSAVTTPVPARDLDRR